MKQKSLLSILIASIVAIYAVSLFVGCDIYVSNPKKSSPSLDSPEEDTQTYSIRGYMSDVDIAKEYHGDTLEVGHVYFGEREVDWEDFLSKQGWKVFTTGVVRSWNKTRIQKWFRDRGIAKEKARSLTESLISNTSFCVFYFINGDGKVSYICINQSY